MTVEHFPGDGENTLELSFTPKEDSVLLFADGVEQAEDIDYTISGKTITLLTFTNDVGDIVDVRYAKA